MKDKWKGWNKVFFPSSGLTSSRVPAGSFLHSCLCWMRSQEALDQAGTCAHCQMKPRKYCSPHVQTLLLLQMCNCLRKQRGWLYRKDSCWMTKNFFICSAEELHVKSSIEKQASASCLENLPHVLVGDSNRVISGGRASTSLGSSVGHLRPLWHLLGLIQQLQVKCLLHKVKWWTSSSSRSWQKRKWILH